MKKVVWVCDFCGAELEYGYKMELGKQGIPFPVPSIEKLNIDVCSIKCGFKYIKRESERVEGT